MITIFFGIIIKILKDIFYFPFWWYSHGVLNMFIFVKIGLKERVASIGVMVWIKNLFVPMYGQKDIWSRIISFFIRVVQIFFRSIIVLFWAIFYFSLFLLWIVGPIVVLFFCVKNFLNIYNLSIYNF